MVRVRNNEEEHILKETKCYVIINKETGVVICVYQNKDAAKEFVDLHNEVCFSYEQLYTIVERDFVGGDRAL